MNGLDTIASGILGAYLLAVAIQGNSSKLIDQAKKDRAYLQWAIAAAVLRYLYGVKELRGVMTALIAVTVVAFGIVAGVPFQDRVKDAWNRLVAE